MTTKNLVGVVACDITYKTHNNLWVKREKKKSFLRADRAVYILLNNCLYRQVLRHVSKVMGSQIVSKSHQSMAFLCQFVVILTIGFLLKRSNWSKNRLLKINYS